MDKRDIIKKAKQVCDDNGVNTYPVGIVSLCEKHGIKVFEQVLPDEVSGFIVIQKEDFENYGTGRLIVANARHRATRRRFTIAHELAHYFLHKEENNEVLYAHRDAGQRDSMETEADCFAANILMPEALVNKALRKFDFAFEQNKIEYIAREFVVSLAAAEIRLSQLNS